MGWTLTDDVGAYRAAVGELLSSEPERNTVLLSVLASLTRLGPAAFGDAAPLFGWWPRDGAPRAAVLQTPPRPMLLTALPGESAGQLARALADRGAALADRGPALSGVNGPEADVTALAAVWRDLTGASGRTHQRQRLYRLGALVPPEPAPDGTARLATVADAAVAGSWYAAFAAETGQVEAVDDVVTDRLHRGQLLLWEVAGKPVSMAGLTDVLAGVARVGPVYTPPGRRDSGYGGAVTAAISELAFSRGAESVILFTDLANPASNSLYRKLGYEPVEDRMVVVFGA